MGSLPSIVTFQSLHFKKILLVAKALLESNLEFFSCFCYLLLVWGGGQFLEYYLMHPNIGFFLNDASILLSGILIIFMILTLCGFYLLSCLEEVSGEAAYKFSKLRAADCLIKQPFKRSEAIS